MNSATINSTSINSALAWASAVLRATSHTPRLDAELLLAHVLGLSRAKLIAEGRMLLAETDQASYQQLIAGRANLEPVAYLIGQREFYGLEMYVNPSVLVPRQETELLVDLALAWAQQPGMREQILIADICTGSGCIAIALAKQLPQAQLYATDISAAALELAARNRARHHVTDRIQLLEGDLLASLPQPVDLLISNPPYTIFDSIDEGVRRHEPRLALDGGPDGLEFYRRLLAAAATKLRPNAAMMFEIGADQGQAVLKLARHSFPQAQHCLHQDLAGHDRVVRILL